MRQFSLKAMLHASLGLILAAGLFSGCYFMPAADDSSAPTLAKGADVQYNTLTVQKSSLEQTVQRVGWMVPATRETVSLQYGGTLKALYIQPGDSVEKGQIIAELATEDMQFSLKTLEINRKIAQYNLDQAKASDSDPVIIQSLNLDMKNINAQLADLKKKIDASKILSPITGVVSYVRSCNTNSYVDTSTPLAILFNPDDLIFQCSKKLTYLPKIGNEASVILNGQEFQGEVIKIPVIDIEGMPAPSDNCVMIRIQNLPADIKVGQWGTAVFVSIPRKDNIITLPKHLVSSMDGVQFVRVLKDGLVISQDVKTGIYTDTAVEILEGLSEGDQVIIQ